MPGVDLLSFFTGYVAGAVALGTPLLLSWWLRRREAKRDAWVPPTGNRFEYNGEPLDRFL